MTFLPSALFFFQVVAAVTSNHQSPCNKAQIPNFEDPTTFYKCDAGRNLRLFHCPPGTMYDRKTEICDWEAHVIAKYGKPHPSRHPSRGFNGEPRNSPGNAAPKPHKRPRPLDNDYDNGEAWQPYLKWKEQFKKSTSPSVIANGLKNMDCSSTLPGSAPTYYQNPEDCTTFYTCNMNRPVLTYCPRGLKYNPKRQGCDDSNPTGCQNVPGSQDPKDVQIYERN